MFSTCGKSSRTGSRTDVLKEEEDAALTSKMKKSHATHMYAEHWPLVCCFVKHGKILKLLQIVVLVRAKSSTLPFKLTQDKFMHKSLAPLAQDVDDIVSDRPFVVMLVHRSRERWRYGKRWYWRGVFHYTMSRVYCQLSTSARYGYIKARIPRMR